MKWWFVIIIVIAVLIVLAALRSAWEVRHIVPVKYVIRTPKLSSGSRVKIVFFSDLHERKYGKDNEPLMKLIEEARPDLILIGGDMLNRGGSGNDETLFRFLKNVPKIAKT